MRWLGTKPKLKDGSDLSFSTRDDIAPRPTTAERPAKKSSIWERAFIRLADAEPDLIHRFNSILASEVKSPDEDGGHHSPPAPTQANMAKLIESRLAAMQDRQWKVSLGKKSIEIRAQVDRILQIVIVAKDLGSSLASMDPVHAGIPWAGVCVILPLLLNDSQQRNIAMKGLEEIAKLIRRFSEVENLYLRKSNHRLAEDLEDELLIMYCKVLEFEARAACQFDRNTASQAIRNIIKVDGWSDLLSDIKESETRCNILTQIMDAENRHKWNDLIEKMMSEQTTKVNELLLISKGRNDEEPRHGMSRANTFKAEEPSSAQRREEAECITLFRTTDYEFDKNKNPPRVPGTCEWVIKHPVFCKWDQEDSIGWLWITANPGCGKSVLARFLTDEFHKNKDGTYICYFFFKDDTATNRSANHALCAILHQLMCYDARLVRHALSSYASNGKQLPHLIESLWKVFVATVEALDRPLLCVFDALDECEESSRLDLLAKLAPLFGNGSLLKKLKIVMTSRPNTPTGDAIWRHGVDPMSIQLTGEREDELRAISSEIDMYVTEKIRGFDELRRHRRIQDDAHELLKQKISSIENQTYLWVALIFPELEKNAALSKLRLSSIIDQIPTTVQEAYEKILNRSLDRQRARTLLHLVVAALKPLTLIEMNVALAIDRWSDQERELDIDPEETFELTIRELCGLFVTVKEGRIYLIHQTAREFLIRDESHVWKDSLEPTAWNWRHSLLPMESHRLAAHTCMLYLLLYSIRNDQSASRKTSEGVSSDGMAGERKWRALFGYASQHWSSHSISMNLTSELLNKPFDTATSAAGAELTWLEMYKIGPRWLHSATHASSALSMASHAGLYPVVRELLLTQSATEDGIRPLRYAICNHHTATIEILLDKIADTEENEGLLNASLHIACNVDEERTVQRLLDFDVVNPAQPDSLGRTSVIWALRSESYGSFMLLTDYFVSKGLPSWSGTTLSACLQVAANKNRVAEMHQLLRQTEVLGSDERLAALQQAIMEDHESAVMILVMTPDDRLNCPQKDVDIAVHMALKHGKAMSAEFLVQVLTNYEARNSDGETPLFIATRNENISLVNALIQRGANVNAVASEGWNRCREGVGHTPLYCATSHQDVAILSLLLQEGAKADLQCHGDDTALHSAVALENVDRIRLLLDSGADPTIANRYGLTADQAALRTSEYIKKEDHTKIVAMLTEAASSRPSERPATRPSQSSSTRTLGTYPPRLETFYPLLSQMKDSLDVETFSQILEMDEADEPYDYHPFSRSIVSGYFMQNTENVYTRCEIAIICGDFNTFFIYLGDFLKGSAQTLGLNKVADLCEEVIDLTRNKELWVGCKDDGDEMADVECFARVKKLYEDIKAENEKIERFSKDFYYEIQDPKYDLQPLEPESERALVNEKEGDGVQKSAQDLPVLERTTSKDSVD